MKMFHTGLLRIIPDFQLPKEKENKTNTHRKPVASSYNSQLITFVKNRRI